MIGDAGRGRWKYEQLLGVWDTYPLKVREKWIDAASDSLLDLCAKSGAIGELIYVDLRRESNQRTGRCA